MTAATVLATLPEPENPSGSGLCATVPFDLVQSLGRQVLDIGGILIAEGPVGTGETVAAAEFCRGLDCEVLWLLLAATTRGNDVLREILGGLREDTSGSGAVLLERARTALAGRRLVIVIDEAHQLHRDALRQIRYLFDQPTARFALILIGRDFTSTWAVAPELESRVARHVRFGQLKGARLLQALAAYHPVLRATDADLLKQINAECCGGNWRTWRNFLVAVIGMGATAGSGITRKIAAGALGAVPPTPGIRARRAKGRRA
jgi:hypothetical protein